MKNSGLGAKPMCWFQIFLEISSRNLGFHDPIWRTRIIFQMGWWKKPPTKTLDTISFGHGRKQGSHGTRVYKGIPVQPWFVPWEKNHFFRNENKAVGWSFGFWKDLTIPSYMGIVINPWFSDPVIFLQPVFSMGSDGLFFCWVFWIRSVP